MWAKLIDPPLYLKPIEITFFLALTSQGFNPTLCNPRSRRNYKDTHRKMLLISLDGVMFCRCSIQGYFVQGLILPALWRDYF
ncbi:MAG: hypothetical protein ACJAUL_003336 [Paraglaciecola sp.]|jgi:hypothetical protein